MPRGAEYEIGAQSRGHRIALALFLRCANPRRVRSADEHQNLSTWVELCSSSTTFTFPILFTGIILVHSAAKARHVTLYYLVTHFTIRTRVRVLVILLVMRLYLLFSVLLLAIARSVADNSGTVPATPHDSYSSSVGVLGCKINTNRVAYWPDSVDCNNICVQLSYEGRSVNLLRIDQSGGAHDVSYDAWNYLYTGYSAKDKPVYGGAVSMQYQNVDASSCAPLINTDGNKLPLSAANSMDFLASCLAQPDSWIAQNYVLYNILDPVCTWGYDETCTLNWPTANQPTCPHTLGDPVDLTSDPVYNIQYGTGKSVLASSGPATGTSGQGATTDAADSSGRKSSHLNANVLVMLAGVSSLFVYSFS